MQSRTTGRSVLGRSPRHWMLLVGIIAIVGSVVWISRRLEARTRWQESLIALNEQNVEAARWGLTQCLRDWPDDAEVHFWAARAARLADDLEEADSLLTATETLLHDTDTPVVSFDPQFERMLLWAQLGDVRELSQAPEITAGTAREASSVADFEREILALDALAYGWSATLQYEPALQCCERLLERQPNHVRGLLLRGRLLVRHREYEEALQCFEQAQLQVPTALVPALRRAETLLALGRIRIAIQQFETLRQAFPANAEVLLGLARCRIDLAQPELAIGHLRQLLQTAPSDPAALVEMSRIALRQGRAEEGVTAAQQALAADPNQVAAMDLLIRNLKALGRQAEADAVQDRKKQLEIDYGKVCLSIAKDMATPNGPQSPFHAAEQLVQLGRLEEALPWFYLALIRADNQPEVYRALARCYERQRKPSLTSRHLRLAEGSPATTPRRCYKQLGSVELVRG